MASESEQEKRETLADIVAMLRANARGERFDEFSFSSLADRIEAAWKREREVLREAATEKMLEGATIIYNRGHGNAAAMRETLLVVRDALDTISAHEDDIGFVRAWIGQTKNAVQEALSSPARQCDVGTAEEQQNRFNRFCRPCTDGCPFLECRTIVECTIKWAQTPYEAQEGAGE